MIHYLQYRPAFFEGFTNEHGEVESVPELLRLPWIDQWAQRSNFHRFSLDRDEESPSNSRLMAEFDHGFVWWVVAHVWDDGIELCPLPDWKPYHP